MDLNLFSGMLFINATLIDVSIVCHPCKLPLCYRITRILWSSTPLNTPYTTLQYKVFPPRLVALCPPAPWGRCKWRDGPGGLEACCTSVTRPRDGHLRLDNVPPRHVFTILHNTSTHQGAVYNNLQGQQAQLLQRWYIQQPNNLGHQ